MGAAAAGWGLRGWLFGGLGLLVAGSVAFFAVIAVTVGMMGGLVGEGTGDGSFSPSAGALADIPAAYLAIYRATGAKYGLDWTYLAAIGSIETNHGRLRAPGVTSGVNAFGCCAGPMQFMITGAGGGTWGAYGVDGNGDGKRSPYDPADAIPAAAKYLKASGAPKDWGPAIFAYNHAGWYVRAVEKRASEFRGAALNTGGPLPGAGMAQTLSGDENWLMRVPGTNATCDRRIVADVVWLLQRGRMTPGDCFATSGHTPFGEHPLGLGLDAQPGKGGSWPMIDRLVRELGWRPVCGRTGCDGQLPSPFRFIGWNGYRLHGDPAHAGGNAHVHFSWQHSGGRPAKTVQTLLGSGRKP
jgi:hypothetical protein